jgi:hypothetical protein
MLQAKSPEFEGKAMAWPGTSPAIARPPCIVLSPIGNMFDIAQQHLIKKL